MSYQLPSNIRSISDINFSVIKRYVPSLHKIIAIAASASIYILTPDNSEAGAEWKRAEIEGTLFVCELDNSKSIGTDHHCIVVLNRKGMDNLIIGSGEIDNVEITTKFLTLSFSTNGETRILGFFIQSSICSREDICTLIKGHWEAAKQEQVNFEVSHSEGLEGSIESHYTYHRLARRLSLSELFGRR
ncbi:BgTH12-03906 [Blumeria graminis f. sp. triticale]|nr:hypothetical protein BGT96224_4341 [Blumeria graminis f. sp. tritici 96224]CAD6499799.1 BgTH12-03906 [Blumeria graminis f. sp. triticale]CCU81767.1 DCP1 superfamily/decapping enzyme [Blumeria hordei DH14]VCU39961.1 Bgt-4341 [Blumeria graminis f. sp. tritici]